MLSAEFIDFYHSWQSKAAAYSDEDLRSAFDKLFTLFVVYNRLYAAATLELAHRPESGVVLRGPSFPDGKAARQYVALYLTPESLIDAIEADVHCVDAIKEIIAFLEHGRFFIKLHRVHGTRQPSEDRTLLLQFRSDSKEERAKAILEFVYSVRCNLFHGQKSFEVIQLDVIGPAN